MSADASGPFPSTNLAQAAAAGILRIAPDDNIGVTTRVVAAGESLEIAGRRATVRQPIPVGHKIALEAIPAGGHVRKYGVPIGSATCDIAPGDYVHTHNLRSNYLPTYTRDHQATG
jgi:altronate dehydratase